MSTESISPISPISPTTFMPQPGTLQVIKRNGTVVRYDSTRIATAIKKAFLAVEGDTAIDSIGIQEHVAQLTSEVDHLLHQRLPTGGTIHIETIQDRVELSLMYAGLHKVSRAYVLYRESRRKEREAAKPITTQISEQYTLLLPTGNTLPLDINWLSSLAHRACKGLAHVDPEHIIGSTMQNLCEQLSPEDLYEILTISAATQIENEPNYTYVAARLLLHRLCEEVLNALHIQHDLLTDDITQYYQQAFQHCLEQGIKQEHIHKQLDQFNWTQLAAALKPERDQQFAYLGLQTLYDRYFIRHDSLCIELPQVFFMRVAMGLAQNESTQCNERAIEFYELLSSFDFMSSTPTLFNAGTPFPQLSSCFLTTIPDSLEGIYNALKDNALLSKYAGGLGNDWTQIRAMGTYIKGTNGKSLGVVPFLNVADATAIAVNQGGKRKGAVCAYLETWHMDIEEFLDLRKNTGDDRRRTHDMNTANWIPDLFMKRVFEKGEWTLFSPDDTPDLHDLFGSAFEQAYTNYEAMAERGKIRSRKIPAVTLWRKMLTLLFETGHPWITFKDACSLRSPQQHAGVIHSSNLCTEITLNTSADEIAVCNLGSINLINHMTNNKLNTEKLSKTIKTAMRMLDNIIDINYYSVPQAKNSNFKHRPVGLGLMGFQDALYLQRIPYTSDAAVHFADQCMEHISYYAISASMKLAQERGTYTSYQGSLWSQGILPIDSIAHLKNYRKEYLDQNTDQTLPWDRLRQQILLHGMRNSNVMAIAPTATISNICGISQSIEPTYQNLFVKSNLSGEFTVLNSYLVHDLKQLGLWDKAMIHDLKYYNGSIQKIDRIPHEVKNLYATAFEMDPSWLIEAASRRQKWIDQSQSLNLYMAKPSGKKLDALYRLAWLRGLKTTYYLRSLGASSTEKATIHDHSLNAVKQTVSPPSCQINDPDCEACQ